MVPRLEGGPHCTQDRDNRPEVRRRRRAFGRPARVPVFPLTSNFSENVGARPECARAGSEGRMTANNPEYRRKLYSKGLCSRHGPGDVTTIAAHPSSASRANRRVVGGRVAALFDEHAAMVLGLCRLLLRDHHEAEDAAQQTLVSAYASLASGDRAARTWPLARSDRAQRVPGASAKADARPRPSRRRKLELEGLSDSSDDLADHRPPDGVAPARGRDREGSRAASVRPSR